MYLTDKKSSTPRPLNDHEDIEMLLESFAKQVEEIVNEAENIQVMKGVISLVVRHLTYNMHRTMCNPRKKLWS